MAHNRQPGGETSTTRERLRRTKRGLILELVSHQKKRGLIRAGYAKNRRDDVIGKRGVSRNIPNEENELRAVALKKALNSTS